MRIFYKQKQRAVSKHNIKMINIIAVNSRISHQCSKKFETENYWESLRKLEMGGGGGG